MDDILLADEIQCPADGDQVFQAPGDVSLARVPDDLRERAPVDKLHHEVEDFVHVIDMIDLRDMRMQQPGNKPRFPEKHFPVGFDGGQVVGNDLQRHMAFQTDVPSLKNAGHAARSDKRHHPVITKLFPDEAAVKLHFQRCRIIPGEMGAMQQRIDVGVLIALLTLSRVQFSLTAFEDGRFLRGGIFFRDAHKLGDVVIDLDPLDGFLDFDADFSGRRLPADRDMRM